MLVRLGLLGSLGYADSVCKQLIFLKNQLSNLPNLTNLTNLTWLVREVRFNQTK
jgi:hypothetical protein